ncbi:MAG TPA: CPBP family intramembrane glutamic endopeptidase [Acidobacteriaceae bacterium]|nr:CPBP family intramembrane glutamic endopeptidase [Acidobacteriaceae bacterium]
MWHDAANEENTPRPGFPPEQHLEPDPAPALWPTEPAGSPLDLFGIPTPVPEPRSYPRRVPNIGHVALFFLITLILIVVGEMLGVALLLASHIFPHHTFYQLYVLASNDARVSIPIQAFCYGLIALVSIPVFTVIWNEPFDEGVRWHAHTARRRFFILLLVGLAVGFSVTFLGDFLPMPKNPPITQDMMKSAAGAWLMLVFGLTVAPMLEELAFRGFLLPGLINSFRWFGDRGIIPQPAADRIGIPISILLTSLGFAYMHSPQVSHAWGPLLLIGIVSVVLCIVRLTMNSVAAGVIVHAAYNFTLFAGVLYQTSGFRHLEKLTG